MSESAWKAIQTGVNVLGVVMLALMLASLFGWIAPDLRNTFTNIFVVLILLTLVVRYVREKDSRPRLRAYANWAIAISIPLVALGFLRDYWQDPWFQSTLFPALFGPVMIATMLGYFLLAYLVFRSTRRSG
jgi:small-conductance mechanosensitive channel